MAKGLSDNNNEEGDEIEKEGGEEEGKEGPAKDEDIYEEKEREEMEEEDELKPYEEGFMEGYEEDGRLVKCAKCGKVIVEVEDAIEREFKGQTYRFCSDKCARAYKFGK